MSLSFFTVKNCLLLKPQYGGSVKTCHHIAIQLFIVLDPKIIQHGLEIILHQKAGVP